MLDNRTLIVVELLIPFSFMIIQIVELRWSHKQAVRSNIIANLFQFLGYLMILFMGSFSDLLLSNLSTLFIIISCVFMLITTFLLFKVRVPIKRFIILGVISFLVLFLGTLVERNKILRPITLIFGLGMLFVYGVFYLNQNTPKNKRKMLPVFSILFSILSTVFIFKFIVTLLDSKYVIVNNEWVSSIYMVELSLLVLIWNYTIQLKRNLEFQSELSVNVSDLVKTQENISLLNYFYHNNSVSSGLHELYPRIFDLLYSYFSIEKAVLFVSTNNVLIPVYHRGIE